MSEYLVTQLENTTNVTVRTGVDLVDGLGEERLEGVVVRDRATGGTEEIPAAALFVFIGAEPRTRWLDGVLQREEAGYLLTGLDLRPNGEDHLRWPLERQPLPLETSLPGVFAAGDVRFGSVKRVASATGEGAMAIQMIHRYLDLEPSGGTKPEVSCSAGAPAGA